MARNAAQLNGLRHGQSLVEFAVLLPAVLILVLLIVRMMMILNIWYTVTNATDIGVRAVALTGNPCSAYALVVENIPGADQSRLSITFKPNALAYGRPPTPTLPPTPTGKGTPQATATPDQKALQALIDPSTIPDNPVTLEVKYDVQIAGPLVPEWKISLSANATGRVESRIDVGRACEFF